MTLNTRSCEAPPPWRPAAVAVAALVLQQIVWDEAHGLATIRGEHRWEPEISIYDLDNLRDHVYGVAHDAWAALVDLDGDGWPVEEPNPREIVEPLLAAYEGQIRAMGWAARMEDQSHG